MDEIDQRRAPAAAPLPANPAQAEGLDSGVSAGRLRHEQDQARFNELYLLAPAGYFVVGFDGRILQANVAGARLLGIARPDATRHRLRDFVRRAWRDGFDAFFEAALNSRTRQRHELELMGSGTGAHGGPAAVVLHANADGSGQACRIVVEPLELAARLEQLARSEERLRRIVHCADEGIWEIDAFGFITFVNPRWRRCSGATSRTCSSSRWCATWTRRAARVSRRTTCAVRTSMANARS
jgi:PAS domain-containing protein